MISLKVTKSLAGVALAAAFLTGCGAAVEEGSTEAGDTSQASEALKSAPAVDPLIAVPEGNRLAFSFDALGVQIYACTATTTPTGTTYSWVLQAPEANLLNKHGKVVGTHYVGPTWEYQDGSLVKGARVAGVTPDKTAIPWLLLKATTHSGEGRMEGVTYVQRLDTAGGLAPTTGCDADHIGATNRSDYAATYYFFRAADDDTVDD